jgi:hypothetical protein
MYREAGPATPVRWRNDLHFAASGVADTQERRGRTMTEDGAIARSEDSGHPGAVARQPPVPHRVDAAVHRVQSVALDPMIDGVRAEPARCQLTPGDDAVLALREGRDRLVDRTRVTLTVYFRHNVTRISHGPMLTALRLRRNRAIATFLRRVLRVYARAMTDVALPGPAVAQEPHEAPPRPDFQVVPLKGLPIVAVVLAALVAAIATDKLWALEFFHVAAGGLWTSFDLFLGFVLGPILGRLAIPARVELTTRLMPKLLLIMPTLVTCTLASGWQLGRLLGTIDSGHPDHGWIVASYVVVGVMAVIALAVLEPANVAVLVELKKRRPDPAVIQNLMKRFIYTAGITGAMQVTTLVIMTKVATG